MASESTLKIAIIGAGPAGLTLARILQHNRIPCTVFERDTSRFVGPRGGTLDIQQGSGQLALVEAGLIEEFKKKSRVEGESLRMRNTKGELVFDRPAPPPSGGGGENKPEIDRLVLRDMLLDSVDPGIIHWGQKLIQVEPSSEGRFKLHFEFEDGSTGGEKEFDLVVGADGAWSKIRPLLTDEKPFYSEITGVESHIVNVDERHPTISERVGSGSCFQMGESKALLAQRQGDGSVKTYAMLRVPVEWSETCGIDWTDEKAKGELVEREFAGWDEGGKELMLKSDMELALRPLWMLPVGIKWDSRPGLTLIGDAAHLMTPFAGVGVNLALVDALELANAVKKTVSGETNLAAALKEYEAAMFVRAEKYARKTYNNLEMRFLKGDTAEVIVQKMIRAHRGH